MQLAPFPYYLKLFKLLRWDCRLGAYLFYSVPYSTLSRSIWNKMLLFFFQLHILIQVRINTNSEWPEPSIGPKVTLFHLSVPTESLQPVLTSFKCTSIHPIHTSLCLVKCIAEVQLYCHILWTTKFGEKKMSLTWLIYSVAPSEHHLSVCQCLAQHGLTHRGTQ